MKESSLSILLCKILDFYSKIMNIDLCQKEIIRQKKIKKQGLPERKALLRQRLAIMRFTILSPAT